MIDPSNIAVVVLAGGQGTRIGGGKPLIKLGTSTLIEQAYDRAKGWSSEAVVVIRSPEQLAGHQLPWIADAPAIEGPLAGLAAALEWARSQGAQALLTIPCDMPFLPQDLPERLLAGIGERGAAIASSGRNLHPVCGLWRVASLQAIPAYCASGQRSLRGFAEQVSCAEINWTTRPYDPFFNINSPSDLAAAEKVLAC